MSGLNDLKKFANELYPGHSHDLPYMLCAWARFNPGNELGNIFRDAGSNIHMVIAACEQLLSASPVKEDSLLLESCILKYDVKKLTGFHLLLTICNYPESRLNFALTEAKIDIKKLAAILKNRIKELQVNRSDKSPAQNLMSKSDTPLSNYGRNLNSMALDGEFDGLADREDEVNSIIDVLLKKNKRNVVITGPAGVGKTSLVQLLARKIASNEIACLKDHFIFEVNIGKLVAGTKYRGEFEQNIYKVLDEVKKHGKTLLFFDEFHLLAGAGAADGVNTDASNLLKPYLTGDTLQIIGATTREEFETFIKTDKAFERRFQEIKLRKPDILVTKKMLTKQAETLEAYHGVHIPYDLKAMVVELADRYISDRNHIDNCLDLLDTSLAHVKRNGETVLSIEALYQTLSLMAGRKIDTPEKNPIKSWIKDFKRDFSLQTADVIVLGNHNPKAFLKIIRNYLRRIQSLFEQKGVELFFEEERLAQYIVSKVEAGTQKSTNIFYLIDSLILRPLAEKTIIGDEIESHGRYVLEDAFYLTGEINSVKRPVTENRIEEIIV